MKIQFVLNNQKMLLGYDEKSGPYTNPTVLYDPNRFSNRSSSTLAYSAQRASKNLGTRFSIYEDDKFY